MDAFLKSQCFFKEILDIQALMKDSSWEPFCKTWDQITMHALPHA